MARRISPAQFKSELRRAAQRQQQAVNTYNAAVRKYNGARKRAINAYNSEVRAHNARVRANRQRLNQEIARLQASSQTTRRVTHYRRVEVVQRSFRGVEDSANSGSWLADDDLLNLSEGEVANSVSVLNALLTEPATDLPDAWRQLQVTSVVSELRAIGYDLVDRWKGALFSLHPGNPDAARHFLHQCERGPVKDPRHRSARVRSAIGLSGRSSYQGWASSETSQGWILASPSWDT